MADAALYNSQGEKVDDIALPDDERFSIIILSEVNQYGESLITDCHVFRKHPYALRRNGMLTRSRPDVEHILCGR